MRLIITRILWNFDLEMCDGMEQWSKQKIYTLWEKGPLMVKLNPRRICSGFAIDEILGD